VCQRLYIATRKRLPTVTKTKAAPYLEVQEVSDPAVARGRFGPDRSFLYVAGAHVECGCGFPAVVADARAKPRVPEAADLKSMNTLAEHLRDACRGHSTVELYLCWIHEEGEPLTSRRTVTLGDLRDPSFRLRHRELLTVGGGPSNKQMQRTRRG